MRSPVPQVDVVIPARNEEYALASTIDQVRDALSGGACKLRFIVVDDGSTDATWSTITDIQRRTGTNITAVRLSRRFGKDAAIMAGLAQSRGDVAVTIDADGQHPPAVIATMLELWKSGADVVNGMKAVRAEDSLRQRATAVIFNWLFRSLTRLDFAGASDFKLLDRSVVRALLDCGDYHVFYRALVLWVGFRQVAMPFDVSPATRESRWTARALLLLSINAIVMFSDLPIYFLLAAGLATLVLCAVLMIILLARYFTGPVPIGYPTLLVLQLATLSLTVTAVGAIGLYVRAALAQSRARPRHIVRALVSTEDLH